MILPQFHELPDTLAAEAFSEMLTPGECTYIIGTYPEELDQTVFPPEGSEVLMMLCAHLEPRGVANKHISAGHTSALSKSQTLKLYKKCVGRYQALQPSLIIPNSPLPFMESADALEDKAIEMVTESDRVLVAGYLVGRLANTQTLFDGLAVPKSVYNGLPLEVRHVIAPVIASHPADTPGFEAMRHLMAVDELSRNIPAAAVASLLPDMRTMQQLLPR